MHPPGAASARRLQTVRGVTERQRTGASSLDSQTFDRMIGQLARVLSRRSLVGGSLGAAVLSAVGLGDQSLARRKGRNNGTARAEACIPTGKKCPARKPRGKKGKTLSCKQCCQNFVSKSADGNKRCACTPDGLACKGAGQCCSGRCFGGVCQGLPRPTVSEPPPQPCLCSSGNCCEADEQCCPQGGDNPTGSICCGGDTTCACGNCVSHCDLNTPFVPCTCNCRPEHVTCTVGSENPFDFTCCEEPEHCCAVGTSPNQVAICCVPPAVCQPGGAGCM
jgi:hypothetical protein